MSDDKDSDKKGSGKKNNPWANNKGKPSDSKKTQGNKDWHKGQSHLGGHGGRGGQEPDLDALIRQAQNNLNNLLPGGVGNGIIGLAAGVILLIAFVSLCTFIVQPGEQAVVQRFGAYERTKTTEGLGFKFPNPIERVTKVNVNEIRRMNIGFIQGLGRTGATNIRDIPEESLMLTSDRNIVDLDLVVQWSIDSAEDFLFNIDDQENTIKKVAESAIREAVGQTRMFPIITTERDQVAQRTKEIIQKNLDEYSSGVGIRQVLIQRAEVHPDVQPAFQDVQSAKQDAEDVQNQAQAYREDILPKARGQAIQLVQEAKGYKDAQIAKSTGDAERFNSIYQAYLEGKDVTKERIYIETMEDVLKNANKIILDQGENGSGVVPYLPLNQLQNRQKAQ
ncbi:MAG: FtsH protease activity modulator HflK [Alphaproteobacteria bacterium]|nr:FtsH protease activity modulator HflK [Alphaproteobacteria bacterium]NCQ89157.1 FtsH protease activity modulator HflK [Alphaproteobacteria bacterium]NCT08261.1 FtsH protease activity modulator HflK [Alphaproteobacteria bacterium]